MADLEGVFYPLHNFTQIAAINPNLTYKQILSLFIVST